VKVLERFLPLNGNLLSSCLANFESQFAVSAVSKVQSLDNTGDGDLKLRGVSSLRGTFWCDIVEGTKSCVGFVRMCSICSKADARLVSLPQFLYSGNVEKGNAKEAKSEMRCFSR
jgi:hypothetical protein